MMTSIAICLFVGLVFGLVLRLVPYMMVLISIAVVAFLGLVLRDEVSPETALRSVALVSGILAVTAYSEYRRRHPREPTALERMQTDGLSEDHLIPPM